MLYAVNAHKLKMFKICHAALSFGAIFILIIISWPTAGNAAKILGLFAHPSESNFQVMRSVMSELARRGHNVTVYSSHRLTEKIENLQEFIIEPEFPFWKVVQKSAGTKSGSLQALSQLPEESFQKLLTKVGADATDYFMSHFVIESLLKRSTDEFNYDLIIVDLFYTEALLSLGAIHSVPTIALVSTNFENYMQHILERMLPVACSAIDYQTREVEVVHKGFWQRLSQIRQCMQRRRLFEQRNAEAQQALIKKHFGGLKVELPSLNDLQAHLSVLLLNNHIPLFTAQPLLPNTIAAGGLHIRNPRELPWNIRRFLDEARSGVVFMNLGNEQLCGNVPASQLKLLFTFFKQRPERILWTCHDVKQIEGQPENLVIQHMVAQSDILAHPHVKAFIMNGDLLSLQEGIVRHVPMLGMPIFRNEEANMNLAVELEVGLTLKHSHLSLESLNWALDKLLNEPKYQLEIRKVSTAFRDRPLGALETSMYWIDYVLRHNGGASLKAKGVGSNFRHLHLNDLFVYYFLMAVLMLILLGVMAWILKIFLRRRNEAIMFAKLNQKSQ